MTEKHKNMTVAEKMRRMVNWLDYTREDFNDHFKHVSDVEQVFDKSNMDLVDNLWQYMEPDADGEYDMDAIHDAMLVNQTFGEEYYPVPYEEVAKYLISECDKVTSNTFSDEYNVDDIVKYIKTEWLTMELDNINAFIEDVLFSDVVGKPRRRCSECGKIFYEGYAVGNGDEYYCSDECLHKHYSAEEWQEMCEEDDTENYFACWL